MKNIDFKDKVTSEDNVDVGYLGPSYTELDDNFNNPENIQKTNNVELGAKVSINDPEQPAEESAYSLKAWTIRAFIHDLPKE